MHVLMLTKVLRTLLSHCLVDVKHLGHGQRVVESWCVREDANMLLELFDFGRKDGYLLPLGLGLLQQLLHVLVD